MVKQERIYSSQQLVQAMRSGVSGVREQLQVLSVLDGTASSWPGVKQAVSDLDYLIDMSAAKAQEMEDRVYNADGRVRDAESELFTLKETVSHAAHACESFKGEVADAKRELHQLSNKLDIAKNESAAQKQELWALEKQRADLASEAEKYKQDSEYMEGEIRSLRATNAEQITLLATLKEESTARNTDVLHLKQQTIEQRRELEQVRKKLEACMTELRQVQVDLQGSRTERNNSEQENTRLKESVTRLTAELQKSSSENERTRDWEGVKKMIEADKSKEELAARIRSHQEAVHRVTQLDKKLAVTTVDLANREERLKQKTAEAVGLSKQVTLMVINNKELQKQNAGLVSTNTLLECSLAESHAEIEQRRAHFQAAQVKLMGVDKDRSLADSKVRELFGAERARLERAAEESKRECVVQKTLAEGWHRDIKELQARLKSEQETISSLRGQLESVSKVEDDKKYETFMAGTLAEQINKDLKLQLERKETELKRLRADSLSVQRRLEKQLESLQRECNESASEIQRLRRGDGLPSLYQPRSIQDELTQLKRLVTSMPGPEPLREGMDNYSGSGGGGGFPVLKVPPSSQLRSSSFVSGSGGSAGGRQGGKSTP